MDLNKLFIKLKRVYFLRSTFIYVLDFIILTLSIIMILFLKKLILGIALVILTSLINTFIYLFTMKTFLSLREKISNNVMKDCATGYSIQFSFISSFNNLFLKECIKAHCYKVKSYSAIFRGSFENYNALALTITHKDRNSKKFVTRGYVITYENKVKRFLIDDIKNALANTKDKKYLEFKNNSLCLMIEERKDYSKKFSLEPTNYKSLDRMYVRYNLDIELIKELGTLGKK